MPRLEEAPLDTILVVVALALAAIGAGLAWRRVGERRRLSTLREAVDALAGEVTAPRAEVAPDELARLARSLAKLRESLAAERRRWERERAERDVLLAHMSDAVALLDRENRVVNANRAFGDLFGQGVAPAPGSPLHDILRSPDILDLVREARASVTPIDRELRLFGAETRALEVRAARVETAEPGAVLLVLRDLTERERQIRIRQDFVANVSHELRTPLTSIRGYAETLLDGGLEDRSNRRQFVTVIREQAARLQTLVEDLLSLAELERSGLDLHRTRFDLRLLANAQAAAFRDRAHHQGLELAVDAGPPVEVLADRGRIEQVLANLLDNALKYTERGGVSLTLGGDAERAWCVVEDTGVGIPEEEQARIFERFYRVDKARSREMGGTGLGLAIVKHILAQHRGEISVESAPGRGSRFRFELPR